MGILERAREARAAVISSRRKHHVQAALRFCIFLCDTVETFLRGAENVAYSSACPVAPGAVCVPFLPVCCFLVCFTAIV